MNRTELETILSFETEAALLERLGIVILSGAASILVENVWSGVGIWDQVNNAPAPLLTVCVFAFLLGGALVWLGRRQNSKKRSFINRIFDEVRPINASTHGRIGDGKNLSK